MVPLHSPRLQQDGTPRAGIAGNEGYRRGPPQAGRHSERYAQCQHKGAMAAGVSWAGHAGRGPGYLREPGRGQAAWILASSYDALRV